MFINGQWKAISLYVLYTYCQWKPMYIHEMKLLLLTVPLCVAHIQVFCHTCLCMQHRPRPLVLVWSFIETSQALALYGHHQPRAYRSISDHFCTYVLDTRTSLWIRCWEEASVWNNFMKNNLVWDFKRSFTSFCKRWKSCDLCMLIAVTWKSCDLCMLIGVTWLLSGKYVSYVNRLDLVSMLIIWNTSVNGDEKM